MTEKFKTESIPIQLVKHWIWNRGGYPDHCFVFWLGARLYQVFFSIDSTSIVTNIYLLDNRGKHEAMDKLQYDLSAGSTRPTKRKLIRIIERDIAPILVMAADGR